MDTGSITDITSHQPDGNVESKLPQFGATWADTDSSHLLPTLPLKHIPRAWERKAQSPLVKQRFARKIWRRHEFPQSLSTTNMTNNDAKPLQHAHVARLKKGFLASHSPKKIVKKRCLLGQTASANQWDQKASTPLRKKCLKQSNPSVSLIQKSPVREKLPDHAFVAAPEVDVSTGRDEEDDQENQNEQDEWSDVASEEDEQTDAPGYEEEDVHSPATPMSAFQHFNKITFTPPDVTSQSPVQRCSSAPLEEVVPPEARQKPRISDDTAILHAFLNRAAASKNPPTPIHKRESLSNRRDSDVVRHALASPIKKDVLAELDVNSPSPRKQPLKAVAIDQCGPIDESLPQKAQQADQEESSSDAAPENAPAPGEDQAKPTRRSIRSRAPVNHFVAAPPSPSKYANKGPNKITIRGAATPVAIKRTEVQELALTTRTNTRKNKGGSVMPVIRLCKLAAEAASPELFEEEPQPEEEDSTPSRKSVKWDTTLAYYQEFGNDVEQLESEKLDPPADSSPPDAAQAPTPMKPRIRRIRTPSKPTPDPTSEPASVASTTPTAETSEPVETVQADEPSKTQPPPAKKRKSRIATPAKGLLSSATLLPADLVLPDTSEVPPPTTTSTAPKPKRSSTRALPAPRKLNLEPIAPTTTATTPITAPAQTTETAIKEKEKEHKSLSTPKKTGIPSSSSMSSSTFGLSKIAPPASSATIPRLEPPSSSSSRPELDVPGLASPAKKRPRIAFARQQGPSQKTAAAASSSAQGDEFAGVVGVPGLASPAKKRVRGKLF